MSIHKLTAGKFDYRTRRIAAQHVTEKRSTELASYCAERGETLEWIGSDLAGGRRGAKEDVTAEQMRAPFGSRHPLARGQAALAAAGPVTDRVHGSDAVWGSIQVALRGNERGVPAGGGGADRWYQPLEANRARDEDTNQHLEKLRSLVVRVWEHKRRPQPLRGTRAASDKLQPSRPRSVAGHAPATIMLDVTPARVRIVHH